MNKKIDINKISFSLDDMEILEKISPTISKARVRLFYIGLNRNGTYITKEFADKLLATLPYTPVGGFWSEEKHDFTDHGGYDFDSEEERRSGFKAFGVVPEDPHLKWEEHLDYDGQTREYVSCDVLLWTARYEQAKEIPTKAQSMELFLDSIDGVWKKSPFGWEYFEFTEGCFLGLTALGKEVEPCFEGAAFYQLDETAKHFFYELEKYINQNNNNEGGLGMEKEKDLEVQTMEHEPSEPATEEVKEIKISEETTAPLEVKIIETSEEEQVTETSEEEQVTETSEEIAEETQELVIEETQEPKTDVSEYELKIKDLEEKVSQYELEINQLNEELQSLKDYKKSQEREKKMKVIEKYSSLLSEEKEEEYKSKIDTYSCEDLKKDIAADILENNETALFGKQEEVKETITNLDSTLTGAAKIMGKYYSK